MNPSSWKSPPRLSGQSTQLSRPWQRKYLLVTELPRGKAWAEYQRRLILMFIIPLTLLALPLLLFIIPGRAVLLAAFRLAQGHRNLVVATLLTEISRTVAVLILEVLSHLESGRRPLESAA